MGDGVRVPAFGQHRHRHDAADRFAESSRFADSVHHLAQQILIGDVLGRPARRRCARSISRRKRSISSDAIVAKLVVQRIA